MNALMLALLPWIDLLGRSLLHFFWQGALIGVLYWTLRTLCPTESARYRLGMSALLAMLACPFITLIGLRPIDGAGSGSTVSSDLTSQVGDALVGSAQQATSVLPWHISLVEALPWLVGVWLVGVCLIATRSFMHWHRLARVVRNAAPLPREWQLQLFQLRERFGILRPVRLLSSLEIATPTLIGWLKPAILLPASLLSGFTPTQIELIIAHELSHVRRFDYIANLAQVAIETLLFYHPVVHWISRDVRQARESCCDDLVLTLGGGERITYARTLADLEELHQDFGHAMPALGAGGGVLFTRIHRIVDPAHALAVEPLPRSNGLTLPLLLAFAGLALLSLRMHLLPASVVQAVLPTPAESLAVLSGNPQFAAVHRSPPAIAATPALAVATGKGVDTLATSAASNTSSELSVDRVARPRIVLAAPALPGIATSAAIANVHTQIALPSAAVATAANESDSAEAAKPAVAELAKSVMPVLEQTVPARYPLEAQQNGVTGKVDLDFRVATDGSVRDIRVLRSQPSGVFEQAAIVALRQWHFVVPPRADLTARYARSFAFTHADSGNEVCREVTGSHICRRAEAENDPN
jgi:TonB family protein